jgi:hypothetical protein
MACINASLFKDHGLPAVLAILYVHKQSCYLFAQSSDSHTLDHWMVPSHSGMCQLALSQSIWLLSAEI